MCSLIGRRVHCTRFAPHSVSRKGNSASVWLPGLENCFSIQACTSWGCEAGGKRFQRALFQVARGHFLLTFVLQSVKGVTMPLLQWHLPSCSSALTPLLCCLTLGVPLLLCFPCARIQHPTATYIFFRPTPFPSAGGYRGVNLLQDRGYGFINFDSAESANAAAAALAGAIGE